MKVRRWIDRQVWCRLGLHRVSFRQELHKGTVIHQEWNCGSCKRKWDAPVARWRNRLAWPAAPWARKTQLF